MMERMLLAATLPASAAILLVMMPVLVKVVLVKVVLLKAALIQIPAAMKAVALSRRKRRFLIRDG